MWAEKQIRFKFTLASWRGHQRRVEPMEPLTKSQEGEPVKPSRHWQAEPSPAAEKKSQEGKPEAVEPVEPLRKYWQAEPSSAVQISMEPLLKPRLHVKVIHYSVKLA